MDELIQREENRVSVLEALASEARYYSENAAMSLLQLGRVLIRAKGMVEHGEWARWLKDNTDMSERSAQLCMQAYRRYGENAAFANIDRSKLFKLMALPAGTEEQFIEEHDVEAMSVREVDEAVKRARAEAQAQIDQERRARQEAERRAYEAEHRPPEIPEDVAEELKLQRERARQAQEDARHFAELARKAGNEKAALERENRQLQKDMDQQQADYDQLNADYLAAKNAQRRADADRAQGDELTPEVFTAAVREFMGLCARMPYMGDTFSAMDAEERRRYDQALRTVEGWTESARRALNTYILEGEIIGEP